MTVDYTSTASLRKQIKTKTVLEQYEDSYKLFLDDTLENSPNYVLATRNEDSTEYKLFVIDYNTDKLLIGYKKYVEYPYDSQVYYVGDYILWNSESWLVFSCDNQIHWNRRGIIKKCNNLLKWKDSNGNILSYKCVIDDKFNNSDLDFTMHMIIPEGTIVVYCQKNDETSGIDINQRFIISGRPYKVNAITDYSSDGLMTIMMRLDGIDIYDDLVNGIANNNEYEYSIDIIEDSFTQSVGYTTTLSANILLNEEVASKSVEWSSSDTSKASIDNNGNLELLDSGSVTITCSMVDNPTVSNSITVTISAVLPSNSETLISPTNTRITQGSSETYEIYRYVDNVQQGDSFTIVATGITTTYYSIATTSNSFTITNLRAYSDGDLTITCTNDVTSEVTTLDVTLAGYW